MPQCISTQHISKKKKKIKIRNKANDQNLKKKVTEAQ
jgi:hypothetical protein